MIYASSVCKMVYWLIPPFFLQGSVLHLEFLASYIAELSIMHLITLNGGSVSEIC